MTDFISKTVEQHEILNELHTGCEIYRVDKSIPAFKHDKGDAGYDLYASEDKWVFPFLVRKIKTNVRVKFPVGYTAKIVGRSGLTSKGTMVADGTIDSNYRGIYHVMMYRIGLLPRKIKKGTRIAQMIIMPHCDVDWEEVDTWHNDTERGERGFGGSGME